ncbi:histidinol-phosphate transaminase [Simonsiella muelleri]|uniref:histidinol-phosphate transaminase n=1 Tax=Simonsiella muelleri TaxID=72 RepID=UPI003C6F7E8D
MQAKIAYEIADIPDDFNKLDATELPYTFPESLQSELAKQLAQSPINRYPNPAKSGLQNQLRQVFTILKSAHIALGNGSDELIQFLTLLVAQPNATVLALNPSFVMYQHNAELFGLNFVSVPLNIDFTLNLAAALDAIAQHKPALIFIAYPNNPTGVPFAREDVQAIIDVATGIVVIDEAYGAFSADSFLSQAGQPEHLVVMRTLSKIGFAGLRLGYAIGSECVMRELAKILPPYNMNWLSLTAAKFALQHYDWIEEHINILLAERERLSHEISQLVGVTVYPSQANFITVKFPDVDNVFNQLKKNKILIKKLHGSHPALKQCLRLTIGTPEQNNQMLAIIKQTV